MGGPPPPPPGAPPGGLGFLGIFFVYWGADHYLWGGPSIVNADMNTRPSQFATKAETKSWRATPTRPKPSASRESPLSCKSTADHPAYRLLRRLNPSAALDAFSDISQLYIRRRTINLSFLEIRTRFSASSFTRVPLNWNARVIGIYATPF